MSFQKDDSILFTMITQPYCSQKILVVSKLFDTEIIRIITVKILVPCLESQIALNIAPVEFNIKFNVTLRQFVSLLVIVTFMELFYGVGRIRIIDELLYLSEISFAISYNHFEDLFISFMLTP